MSLQTKIVAALVSVIVLMAGALAVYQAGYLKGDGDRAAIDQAAINKQKAKASAELAAETAKVLARERELADLRAQQEKVDASNQQTVADLEGRLRALAGAAGRLRDPHAARCGPGGGGAQGTPPAGAPGRPADGAAAGGLLSAELDRLLRDRMRQADQINLAYISCRADLMRRAQPPP
jgi:cell division protein FtsB